MRACLHKYFGCFAVFLILSTVSACGGGGGGPSATVDDNTTTGRHSIAISSTVLPSGTTCANGGVSIDSGIDDNGNGVLDSTEVDKNYVVCNGSPGLVSLIKIFDEPAGTNCLGGGKKISSGLDVNSDGVLDAGEVTDTQYLCVPPVSATPPCTVVDNGDGTATVQCTDGSSVVLSSGANGVDGSSCSVSDNGDGTATISCSDGSGVTIANGADGTNGSSCSVVDNGNGTSTLSCTDGTSVIITNGVPSGARASIFCQGTFSDWTSLSWNYSVYELANGDVVASASISDSIIATYKTNYYSATQVGASTAAVIFTRDVLGSASYGWWKISLDRSNLVTYLEYNDLGDLIVSPKIWYMTPDKCTVQTY